jgi:hypothetical protein
VQVPPNTWLQPTAVDLVASLPAPTVPSLRSAAAEPKLYAAPGCTSLTVSWTNCGRAMSG